MKELLQDALALAQKVALKCGSENVAKEIANIIEKEKEKTGNEHE